MNKGLKYIVFKNQFDNIKNNLKSKGIYYKDKDNSVLKFDFDTLQINISKDDVVISCNFIGKHYSNIEGDGIMYFRNNTLSDYTPITEEQYENYPKEYE